MESTQAAAGSSGGGGEDPPDAEKIKRALQEAAEKGTVDLSEHGPIIPGLRPPGFGPMMPAPSRSAILHAKYHQSPKAHAKSRPTHAGVEAWPALDRWADEENATAVANATPCSSAVFPS